MSTPNPKQVRLNAYFSKKREATALLSIRKSLVVLLALVLVVSTAACTSSNNNNKTKNPDSGTATSKPTEGTKDPEPEVKEEITLDVFSMLSNFSGEQTGWFAKVIKDKFNIKLNIIASNLEGGGDTKFATMMASGDLGDLVVFGDDGEKYLTAIEAGMLVDWTKDGLLDNKGKNILKYAPKAIEKNKANFGKGSSVYGIGFDVGDDKPGPSEAKDLTYHPNLRWDLYEKLGRPAIKTMEDYLPVLKQMQELEPKSATGRPTYAFSMWADWDGNMMVAAKAWAGLHGFDEGDGFNPGGFSLVSGDKEEIQGVLDEDGYYLRGLKLYYDANQMGLVDPDSITQKFDDVVNKMKDGQLLFTWFPWLDDTYNTAEHLAEGKGFALVPFDEERTFSYGYDPYGGQRVWAIGSKAKHPDRVLELVDWLYSPEGMMISTNGPEGLTWELKDGKPVLTDFGVQALPANDSPVAAEFGGGSYKDGMNQLNNTSFKNTNINPDNGDPYDYNLWNSVLEKSPSKLEQSWRDAMGGALTAKEYLEKNNKLSVLKMIFTGTPPEIRSPELEQKRGQVADVIKQYSWKMVFAKNEAEFTKLRGEMIDKAKGLGYDEVLAFGIEQNKKVFEYRKK
ncbi:extracellular solute-binding protein [Paenibacillus luteus]|uniref:extracellular solute-binding protein n=1 Tax=Paenibacillus luteus TaxID=2545753 RepID=UPI0011416C25|nr:extracellular solute-binding protein [Paenibacillus luteus]